MPARALYGALQTCTFADIYCADPNGIMSASAASRHDVGERMQVKPPRVVIAPGFRR